MARTIDAPETTSSETTWLSGVKENEGLYLMLVNDAFEDKFPTKDGTKPMDGISFSCEVIGGVNNGKTYTLMLFDGKMSHKDEGRSARQKQSAFLIATDVIKPDQLGQSISYEVEDAIGSFFVIDLLLGDERDGKRYLEMNYANCFHVDDPRAKKLKLDAIQAARVKEIKPAYRHEEAYFAKLTEKKSSEKKSEKKEKPDFSGL